MINNNGDIATPWLVLCEGAGDRWFIDRLIKSRGIAPGKFTVRYPNKGGRGDFGNYLAALQLDASFRSNVKAILVVADNDDSPEDSFKLIRTQLEKVKFLAAPKQDRQVASTHGLLHACIAMIPFNNAGNLETLCLKAAYEKWGLEGALNQYVEATPAKGWGVTAQSKMRIQSLLAATCQVKPDVNLAQHGQLDEMYHIPVNHQSFDELAKFLVELGNFLLA